MRDYKEDLMKNWKTKLKQQWDENPLGCIVVGALAVTATAKLIDTVSQAQSRRAYAQQVDYRISHKK
jgi:hypothetical protein